MFTNHRSLEILAILVLGSASCTARSKAPPGSGPTVAASDPNPAPSPTPSQIDPCADPANTDDRCVPPYSGDQPIDRVLHPYLWKAHITPVDAGTSEICRRLYADLAGRFPSTSETQATCANKTIDQIARALQATDAYIVLSERHWRDRLDTNDIIVDWRYLKSLYEKVDALHQGTLKYGDFAEAALVHPGFVMMEFEGPKIAQRVFRSFLGREATTSEADDLGALYRPWVPIEEPDPDFNYLMTARAYLLPYLCNSIAPCRASLFGGLDLNIPDSGTGEIRWEDLDAIQLDALKDVSRLIVRQPYFWEAAADEILDRLLAWNDGGRFPRRPGVLLPEVREVLANYLRETGDYPGAERLVLTSLLYRQTARVASDGLGDDPNAPVPPVWASGPVKPALAAIRAIRTSSPSCSCTRRRWTRRSPQLSSAATCERST
jgi:hypothetical protein